MEDECVEELGRPISSLKVAELRDELTKRALTKTGNKKELIDRLRTAIQRQSTNQSSSVEQMSQQPTQQQFQQNVPPYIDAAVAMQQNQAATAYQHQLSQIQPQAAQLAAYSIPMNQQQFQQTMIQPLNLQQLNDYQNQVQLAEFQHQQFQQQQLLQQNSLQDRSNVDQQQEKTQKEAETQPPIDMRVPQTSKQDTPEQSIDLSNNSKQQQQQRQEEPIAEYKADHDVAEENILQECPQPVESKQSNKTIEMQSEFISVAREDDNEVNESSSNIQTEINTQEQAEEPTEVDVAQDKVSIEEHYVSTQEIGLPEETTSQKESPPRVEAVKTPPASENLSQASFTLKRSLDSRGSSGSSSKEKRRRWSSKAPTDGSHGVEPSQQNLIVGGISSQKLQVLIEEKVTEASSKSLKLTSGDTRSDKLPTKANKDGPDILEEGELDASGDSIIREEAPQPQDAVEVAKKIKESAPAEKALEQPIAEPEIEPTNALLIQNLVRPFTLTQLKEVLTKHGPLIEDKFWTDKVKSKCCVMYETVEVAQLTKESLHGQQWPSSNPKTLKVCFTTEETLELYKKSDLAKSTEKLDAPENGSNTNIRASKPIMNRLGESDAPDLVKNRLGDRVSGEISTKSSNVNREDDGSKPQELDDLFKKTKSAPHLYWLPLTESQADVRQKERKEREVRNLELKSRRSPPRRRRSPVRHRSPPRRRPSPGRRPLHRYRSPLERRPSPRRRTPSPSPSPSSRPSPRRRSPERILVRRPDIQYNRPSGPDRRAPGHDRRSRSTSPDIVRRPPDTARGSSPGLIRRLPGAIRRDPAPIRGAHEQRSPPRRRSPPPPPPAGRNTGYGSDRYIQRQERLR